MGQEQTPQRGKYELLELLGRGGMGSVYRARHAYTGEVGALKVLSSHRGADEQSVTRFAREARTVSLVQSPHIVRVTDAGGLDSKRPFIFMELLDGFTLKALLQQQRLLPLELAFEFVRQAARGLGAAHAAGIVHRDVKPENLFLATPSSDEPPSLPVLKLLDFGISKLDVALDAQTLLTRQGAALGTPGYMAPEQFYDSSSVDPRADVYALGVVAYQCLTGRLPFRASTMRAQSEAAHRGDYPSPCELRPELPEGVADAIDGALRVDVAKRHASCSAFAEALEPFSDSAKALGQWREVVASHREKTRAVQENQANGERSSDADAAPEDLSRSPDTQTIEPWISWVGRSEPSSVDSTFDRAPSSGGGSRSLHIPLDRVPWRPALGVAGLIAALGFLWLNTGEPELSSGVNASARAVTPQAEAQSNTHTAPRVSPPTTPVVRAPSEPAPSEPAPSEPAPSEPAPSEPAPSDVRLAPSPVQSAEPASATIMRGPRKPRRRLREDRVSDVGAVDALPSSEPFAEGKHGTRFVTEFE